MRADGGGGFLQVVVRYFPEEQVVHHVPVGDVVVDVVDTPAVRSVHGLHRRGGKVEVRVVKSLVRHKLSNKQSANK